MGATGDHEVNHAICLAGGSSYGLEAAAGVAGLIKAALALHHRILPPTMNCERPRKDIDWENGPFYLITEPCRWDRETGPRRAAVDSFGFGGINFNVVLEEAPGRDAVQPPSAGEDQTRTSRPEASVPQAGLPAELLVFRAPTRAELVQLVAATRDAYKRTPRPGLREVHAFGCQPGQPHVDHRSLFVR